MIGDAARALEQAIELDPGEPSNYAVYADHLAAQGDPRGELAALMIAAEARPERRLDEAARALREAYRERLLGPLAAHEQLHDGSGEPALRWRFGFIHGARLSHLEKEAPLPGGLAGVLELLLEHPSARFLTELTIGWNGSGHDPDRDLQDLIDVLASRPRPALRALRLGDFDPTGSAYDLSDYRIGALGALWAAVPNLQTLAVQGGAFELGALELPALVRADFITCGLSAASARAIAAAAWPRLEHLDVWYGDEASGAEATVDDVAPLLARADLPALRHLGLKNTALTDALCELLPDAPLARQIYELDLSMGVLTAAGARRLAARRRALANLDVLDVSRCFLGRDDVRALRGVARLVVSRAQRKPDEARAPYVRF